jgi:hypothetical protein
MKPKLTIPEDFILVCRKMYPEIEDITYCGFLEKKLEHINPLRYREIDKSMFFVQVNIHFVQGFHPKGVMEYYTEKLNKAFQFTYGIHNINIIVEGMFVLPEKTEHEIFFEIFRPSL